MTKRTTKGTTTAAWTMTDPATGAATGRMPHYTDRHDRQPTGA
jgi:hypothetical protein